MSECGEELQAKHDQDKAKLRHEVFIYFDNNDASPSIDRYFYVILIMKMTAFQFL